MYVITRPSESMTVINADLFVKSESILLGVIVDELSFNVLEDKDEVPDQH